MPTAPIRDGSAGKVTQNPEEHREKALKDTHLVDLRDFKVSENDSDYKEVFSLLSGQLLGTCTK